MSSLKSDMVHTVMSFFGTMNVGEAYCNNDCHFNTPMDTSQLLIRVALCICAIGYGLPCWYGLDPSFNSIEMDGQFQLPRVPSKSNSCSSSSESSFSWCDGSRWEQLSLTMAGKSAVSYLGPVSL
jgi:hypothetical protein